MRFLFKRTSPADYPASRSAAADNGLPNLNIFYPSEVKWKRACLLYSQYFTKVERIPENRDAERAPEGERSASLFS
ncbi:MAG: hypothetical protein AB1649_33550, partial [Chloroflexota bacterium]